MFPLSKIGEGKECARQDCITCTQESRGEELPPCTKGVCSTKISKEDAQLIFKLRCRVTHVKTNLKGKYENLECRACKVEEESQKHIIECKSLNEENVQEMEYEKIYNGTVAEKLKIARKFWRNIEKVEQDNVFS